MKRAPETWRTKKTLTLQLRDNRLTAEVLRAYELSRDLVHIHTHREKESALRRVYMYIRETAHKQRGVLRLTKGESAPACIRNLRRVYAPLLLLLMPLATMERLLGYFPPWLQHCALPYMLFFCFFPSPSYFLFFVSSSYTLPRLYNGEVRAFVLQLPSVREINWRFYETEEI